MSSGENYVSLSNRIKNLESALSKQRGRDSLYIDKATGVVTVSGLNVGSAGLGSVSGEIRSTKDVFPRSVGRGLSDRTVWPLGTAITSHFTSGALPAGYSWLAAGTIGGVNASAPSTELDNYKNDYLYVSNAAAKACFLYKGGITGANGLYVAASQISLTGSGGTGVRIDRTSDNDFFECYLKDASNGTQNLYCRYNDNGGGITTTAILATYPAQTCFCFDIYLSGAIVWAFVINELGIYAGTSIYSHTFVSTWVGTTCRFGLVENTASSYGAWDAFYCNA